MTDPTTERVRSPKQRWQSSARWTLVAVLGVTFIGGLGFYFLFLRGDADPPPPARPVTVTSVATTTVPPATVVAPTVASTVASTVATTVTAP